MHKIDYGKLCRLISDLEYDDAVENNDVYDALIELRAYRSLATLEEMQELARA